MRAIRFILILSSPEALKVLSVEMLLATVEPKKQSWRDSGDVCRGIGLSEGIEDVYVDEFMPLRYKG